MSLSRLGQLAPRLHPPSLPPARALSEGANTATSAPPSRAAADTMGLKNSVLHVQSAVEENIKDELLDIRRIIKPMNEERTREKQGEREHEQRRMEGDLESKKRDETMKMEVLELRKWITARDEAREGEREQREELDKTREKERRAQELERKQHTRDAAAQVTNIFEQTKIRHILRVNLNI